MQKMLAYVRWTIENLDWLIAIALSIVVSILGILGRISANTIFATTLLMLGLLSFGALRDRGTSRHLGNVVNELEAKSSAIFLGDELFSDKRHTGISRVIPQLDITFNWLTHIKGATQITMTRVRYGFAESSSYYESFEAVLAKGGSVTLVLADPRSPAMWLRYMEEPTSLLSALRPGETPWVNGLEDLAIKLNQLHSWRQGLIREGRDVSKLEIKVSSHYPTQAFYKFDNAIYVHDYPYMERGFHAPMFLFTEPTTSVYKFLSRCIQSIVHDSDPLESVIDGILKEQRTGRLSDDQVRRTEIVLRTKGKDTTKLHTKKGDIT